jgi:hypothetical protein
MSVTPTKPTVEQKSWLARVFGPKLWQDLCAKPEFRDALDSSMATARMIALRHLATKGGGQ